MRENLTYGLMRGKRASRPLTYSTSRTFRSDFPISFKRKQKMEEEDNDECEQVQTPVFYATGRLYGMDEERVYRPPSGLVQRGSSGMETRLW